MRSFFFISLLCAIDVTAQPAPDLTKQPTLYVVGYAHLDTEWRWEYPRTINEFLPRTLHDNFALFEKYPHYIFNFSGANRYRMMQEYYPADYEKLRQYVKSGRWFPAGSSMEESDVNSPSAESIIRQVLYGSNYFRNDFGRTSAEYMLPDCFGFPASLPSILAHMGLKGFSTQKLTWGSAASVGGDDSPERTPRGIPFNVGLWEGPDGRRIIAAFNPGNYSGDVSYDLSSSERPDNIRNFVDWPERVKRNGEVSGLYTDYHYYGTGDVGGAPREPSVKLVESIVTKPVSPLRVISATADAMFLDIKPADTKRLPRYEGELELTQHSAGSLTSQAYQKRWNRKNELLADAAERASVAAEWLGGRAYPRERLNAAWTLVMGGQFHDIAAGTATPKSYEYSWNDDVVAMNQFSSVLTSAVESIASGLDTQTHGTAIVVYNPLNVSREDIVEASVPGFKAVRVFGPDGKEVASQISDGKVIFVARVPSVGYAVYDIRPANVPASSALKVNATSLENSRYRIQIDGNGDMTSIFDKKMRKELLSAPARLAFQTEKPHDWPAWNMDWSDQQQQPRAYVSGPATVRIVENGAARVAVEISRQSEGSRFVQTVRLAAGDAGNRIELVNAIDWKTEAAALKATFPLTVENPQATYNWEVGTIQRANNDEKKYEVASHQWFDLTDRSGAYGVTVLSDCKYGSDKPDDKTLRLTLLYTPGLGDGNGRAYSDQTTQDWGHHEFVYGLAAHTGDWRSAGTDWQALRLNQPLIAFESPKHTGALGRRFSLLRVSNTRVRVMALKKAEESDETIVRLVELDGKRADDVHVIFGGRVRSAREVNGQEMPIGKARVNDGQLVTSLKPYQLRTFALELAPSTSKVHAPKWVSVALPYERSVASPDGAKASGGFDASGRTLPAEMLPRKIEYGGIAFGLAPATEPNAVVTHGQSIALPQNARRAYVLAAADGDQKATFRVGSNAVDVDVQDWGGTIGQWDNRTWLRHEEELPPRPDAPPGAPPRKRTVLEYTGLVPGFIKPAPVAWFASHRHTPEGVNEPYAYSYLFAYAFDVPANTTMLTLPDNTGIRVLAITTSDEAMPIRPVHPLYDSLQR
jgi:alpha-mannosidase